MDRVNYHHDVLLAVITPTYMKGSCNPCTKDTECTISLLNEAHFDGHALLVEQMQ